MFHTKQKNKQQSRRASNNSTTSFRRNNVVVSSRQREVLEHQQSVSQRQTDAFKRRKHLLLKRRVYALVTSIIIIVTGYRMQISHLNLTRLPTTTPLSTKQSDEYLSAIDHYISQHIILRQSWLLNTDELTQAIQHNSPEVVAVKVATRNPIVTTASVMLEFRKPLLVYKGLAGVEYIDAQGVIFSINRYKNVPVATLPVVEDQGGIVPDPGQTVLSKPVITDIAHIYTDLPLLYPKNTRVTGVILPRSSREIQAKISGQPYYIKFSTDRSISDQMGELRQLLPYLASNHIVAAQSIDVRVENKAFYK